MAALRPGSPFCTVLLVWVFVIVCESPAGQQGGHTPDGAECDLMAAERQLARGARKREEAL
jgi:hypothetical protein